ncbi:thiol:disulfide interchange protein DsbA/DsbL [Aliidiomarina maris]|uniref:Thiol:disulfide interchange protein n=1 Tax=Aliidiomarina maris TaxID=531312 RepID=A0A327WQ85_9GAMM|nr:thiol:disulfide interchange protein DsbA/DsbL [Aliidiomarina maris]MCL5049882.1 thiol:disulfide interchange protein DsbA/DsbL [Bacillota bacterium]RAJ93588.1 thiol:disulfide interchange protein DsbA [Aliidiomarina maris]RUO18780.1 disulfide isomerase [Aliidiomarina maris]
MKKFWLAMAAAASMVVTAAASATDFREGVHYDVIAEQATEEVEIIDFFSFYCGSCYQFQPFSQMMKAEFGDSFKKYHVNFIGARNMGDITVRAWAAANILGVSDEVAPLIFRKHFQQRQVSSSIDDLAGVFAAVGVDREAFDNAYNSFPARSQANRMRREAENFNVSATPTFIVNGRYRMNPQGFRDSEDFFNDYLELAKYLAQKDS